MSVEVQTLAASDAIKRMTQIITQKFVGQPAASASTERAKRIFAEMVGPEQLARRQAEAEAERLHVQNMRLQEELNELKASVKGTM